MATIRVRVNDEQAAWLSNLHSPPVAVGDEVELEVVAESDESWVLQPTFPIPVLQVAKGSVQLVEPAAESVPTPEPEPVVTEPETVSSPESPPTEPEVPPSDTAPSAPPAEGESATV